jgi:hypothetical protein
MRDSLRLKTLLTAVAGIIFCFLAAAQVQAQGTNTNTNTENERLMREEAARKAADNAYKRASENNRQEMIRSSRLRTVESKPDSVPALTDEQKKFLAVSVEDQTKFADFLKQPNTGMIRLFPHGKFESGYTVSADEPEGILSIKGGGAFYSFSKKTHIFGLWSDICLRENVLYTSIGEQSFGLFTALGDVPLESVTLQMPKVEFLHKLVPPKQISEIVAQRNRNAEGIRVGEVHYGSAFRVMTNLTYVIRSINYKQSDSLSVLRATGNPDDYPTQRFPTIIPQPYEGADVLIAFRVIHHDPEEGITIIWKQLKKSSAPELKNEKK